MNWIISWIGDNDLKAAAGQAVQGMGPIGDFLTAAQYDDVLLLHNRAEQGAHFADWIELNFGLRPQVLSKRPTNGIFQPPTTRDTVLSFV